VAPLTEERSGAGKRRSGCRGDVASAVRAALLIEERSGTGKRQVAVVVKSSSAVCAAPLIEERSGAGKRRSGCRGDVVLGGLCSTTD